jgi:crotonobetainyl-CoA:carnitine CoA-transferase CaiB-like acyl-CoA transferase
MSGPLHGVRVLDLSRVLAGPWATQLLADYGADVIKVERPGTGDDTRKWGPPWLRSAADGSPVDAAYYLAANRNKRSITCNLSHPDGAAIVRDLAAGSDVVVENFRVGTLGKFGLDYASLREINPRLIYCSVTAFGQEGARAQEAGYDAMIQASAGLMSITGEPESRHGRPQKVGVAVSDIMAGMYAASSVLAALYDRQVSGTGRAIDVPLFDSQVAWLANQAMNYLVGGETPGRLGTAHPNIVPYQSFATADGDLMLAVGNDEQFAACVGIMGLGDLANDDRYRDNERRLRNRDSLIERLSQALMEQPTSYWLDSFRRAGVPAGPINDLAQVFSDPHVAERGLVRELDHPVAGHVPTVVNPVRFSGAAPRADMRPPMLGEHTEDVLKRVLGYSADEIDALRSAGAI